VCFAPEGCFVTCSDKDPVIRLWQLVEPGRPAPLSLAPEEAMPWGPALVRRGRLQAASAQWRPAAADYARAAMPPGSEKGYVDFEQACLFLLTGDEAGYRRTCARLLELYGGEQKPRGFLVARACILAPGSVDNLTRAEAAGALELKGNQRYWALTASAGLHYRAGRYPQAAELLHQCLKDNPTWDGKVLDWLWLALTYHQMGKEGDARQWLDKATRWLDQSPTRIPEQSRGIALHLHDWLEAQVLRREAESLIAGKKHPPEK
jgi:tetratricopeptide (TPR) repeat protein